MIIDAHTHIYPDDVAHKALNTVMKNGNGLVSIHTDGTHNGLISSMDKAGIDYSIVLPVATGVGHGKTILEWIKKINPLSERIIFFGSVHPHDPGCRETIKEMCNAGIQGIKFHPGYQNFPANSIEALRAYEEILKKDMVLHFHSGFDPSLPQCDYTSVERFSTVVKSLGGSKIVLAHAGGMDEWQKVIDLLGNRGCYFDLAWVLEKMRADDVARELYRQNEDYFLFGTDTPWCDQTHYVQLIQNSDTLTPAQRDKLFFKNILKLIDLP
jgi:predicted TIM-barrel fold metal-dependent hydrolase